jgi:acyl dehydratase
MAPSEVGPDRSVGPITRTDIVRYAGASGDLNRLHHDDDYARTQGFPSVFSMGMFQAGLLASYLVDWLGADALAQLRLTFRCQVWPGDTLTFAGRLAPPVPSAGGARRPVELTCVNQRGEIVVDARAEYLVEVAP